MNLSPLWCDVLGEHGFEAVHWSAVGDPRATDRNIMAWAREHGFVVFTHDLDFGAILAATQAGGPSVIQARTQDQHPAHLAPIVVAALRSCEAELHSGAIVTIDEGRARIRLLPLSR
jgi:predicted nuclease of predicted toxin-antitoxin system